MDDRRARTEAIEGFAATLCELRNSVGNPPFREMSGRSGAISHTTLHEATKGNRLPSWETTVEFVKACGADPAAYRDRWESANRAVRTDVSVVPASRVPAVVTVPETVHLTLASPDDAPAFVTTSDEIPEQESGRRFRLNRPVAFAAAAVATGAVILVVAAVNSGTEPGGQSPQPSAGPSMAALSPDDCPMRSTNPPAAPPAHKGDAAVFVEDVTLPDCTLVGAGKTLTKVWRIKNAGSVPWKGYSLRRLDLTQQADQCQTIPDVPIEDTQPGETVDIRTVITTPRKPGLCYVRFKMVDASGTVVFPGSRPVNFQIIVGGL